MEVFKFEKDKLDMCLRAYMLMNDGREPRIFCNEYTYKKMPAYMNPFSGEGDRYYSLQRFPENSKLTKIRVYIDNGIPYDEVEIK